MPLIEGAAIIGWQLRPGCPGLLDRLGREFALCLWSVSSRRYVEHALAFGPGRWFAETYSWDELPCRWKDMRRIGADLLADDSPHHRQEAEKHWLGSAQVVVPAYGTPEDAADQLRWARLVEAAVSIGRR